MHGNADKTFCTQDAMSLSIVIPVLNEASGIVRLLNGLAGLRMRGAQVVVVDGGSTDDTCALAAPLADAVIQSKAGRANQMNAGAAHAKGDALLFLHADSLLPPEADVLIAAALANCPWGRFDVRFDGTDFPMPVIAAMMNLRSRVTGIATGDQAMFMRREVFACLGGFAPIPLMEDIELSQRLKRVGPPACLQQSVMTSSRRWEKQGVWRTVFLMWRLRLAYFLGADPRKLAIAYGYRVPE
jgi:rSAM/selenodomain-associated transferase 2